MFKKKTPTETEEAAEVVVPEVVSPEAEELVETQEEESVEETENLVQEEQQLLEHGLLDLNERVSKIESVLFRNLN